LLIAAHRVVRRIVSKSTVAHTKIGHVSKTTPLLGVICQVSLCTKFESSSFRHSWDMDGAPKIWKVSRDVTMTLSGMVCRPSARTSYDQPVHQIWSLYIFTHYEDVKGDKKCKNWGGCGVSGHPRSSETSPYDRPHMTSHSTLIETMRLSCTVFEL